MATTIIPHSPLCERTCEYLHESFADREGYVREHWTEILEGFCRENIEKFHNYVFRKQL